MAYDVITLDEDTVWPGLEELQARLSRHERSLPPGSLVEFHVSMQDFPGRGTIVHKIARFLNAEHRAGRITWNGRTIQPWPGYHDIAFVTNSEELVIRWRTASIFIVRIISLLLSRQLLLLLGGLLIVYLILRWAFRYYRQVVDQIDGPRNRLKWWFYAAGTLAAAPFLIVLGREIAKIVRSIEAGS